GTLTGVVHRDVSPQNIFVLDDGSAKVIDFGIARSDRRDRGEVTTTGVLRGKPAYMAPEQLRHFALDRRTAVFALGVVLWEAITGRRLFRRATEMDTMLAVVSQPVPVPTSVRPDCPPALERIVMRALERDPAARFATAAAMARELDGWAVSTG